MSEKISILAHLKNNDEAREKLRKEIGELANALKSSEDINDICEELSEFEKRLPGKGIEYIGSDLLKVSCKDILDSATLPPSVLFYNLAIHEDKVKDAYEFIHRKKGELKKPLSSHVKRVLELKRDDFDELLTVARAVRNLIDKAEEIGLTVDKEILECIPNDLSEQIDRGEKKNAEKDGNTLPLVAAAALLLLVFLWILLKVL